MAKLFCFGKPDFILQYAADLVRPVACGIAREEAVSVFRDDFRRRATSGHQAGQFQCGGFDGRQTRRIEGRGKHEKVAPQIISRKERTVHHFTDENHLVGKLQPFGFLFQFFLIRAVAYDEKAEIEAALFNDLQCVQNEIDALVFHNASYRKKDVFLPGEGVLFVDFRNQFLGVRGVSEVGSVADHRNVFFIAVGTQYFRRAVGNGEHVIADIYGVHDVAHHEIDKRTDVQRAFEIVFEFRVERKNRGNVVFFSVLCEIFSHRKGGMQVNDIEFVFLKIFFQFPVQTRGALVISFHGRNGFHAVHGEGLIVGIIRKARHENFHLGIFDFHQAFAVIGDDVGRSVEFGIIAIERL